MARRAHGVVTRAQLVGAGVNDEEIRQRLRRGTLPRTLVDLAAVLDLDDLARACHEAGVRYGTTPAQVAAVLGRRPKSPGAAKLRLILDGDAPVTLSRLEKRFLALLRRAGVPLPETNRPAGGRRVDCRWPQHALTVELDSYRYHHSRHAWEQDRRYTWGDAFEDPALMLAELRVLLATALPAPRSGTR